jgi:hypothetical protein
VQQQHQQKHRGFVDVALISVEHPPVDVAPLPSITTDDSCSDDMGLEAEVRAAATDLEAALPAEQPTPAALEEEFACCCEGSC